MQVDFHHGVTYVVCRLAGFTKEEANIVAYASQFVDDAVDSGKIYFQNESIFEFISSAHKMLDYRNFEKLANHHVWIPFHFLPANEVDPAWEGVVPEFVQRAICKPNSCTAQEMLKHTIANKNHPSALHRLGVTMHVYADTWAHQGFAGISHHVTTVLEICDHLGSRDHGMHDHLESIFGHDWLAKARSFIESKLVNEFAPVGHGPVLSYPDRPYLTWQYEDWNGKLIVRDNPATYMDAVDHMFQALCRYRQGSHDASHLPMHQDDRSSIEEIIRTNKAESGKDRHQVWLDQIADGRFSFGSEAVSYREVGPGSWRHEVFPDIPEDCTINSWLARQDKKTIPFPENFPFSHWKLFHDALECHRTTILNFILPTYGIVAA